jgi:hypothetical protein
MAFKVNAVLHLYGEMFSPTKWEKENGITCKTKSERGSVFRRGPHMGLPQDFGEASLDLSAAWQELFLGGDLEFWEHLRRILMSAQENGASNNHVQINVAYSDQCNLSFAPEALKQLASLGVEVCFTAYQIDDDGSDDDGYNWKI